jgi:hypothetical protein
MNPMRHQTLDRAQRLNGVRMLTGVALAISLVAVAAPAAAQDASGEPYDAASYNQMLWMSKPDMEAAYPPE